MSKQEIPEAAIEAATKALHKHFAAEFDGVNEFPPDEYTCCARTSIEAATPLMLASAWDEGERAGVDAMNGTIRHNPYRPTP